MIKIYKYGEVANSEIFARDNISANVEGVVSEIIANVIKNGDAALFEYSEKFDKAHLTSLEVSEEEMKAVDRALLFSLGIETLPSAREPIYEKHLVEAVGQLERLKAERDRYAKMVDHLLGAKACD